MGRTSPFVDKLSDAAYPARDGRAWQRRGGLFQPQRRLIHVEDRFHLLAIMHRHFAQAHDLAHDLGVITLRLRFAVNVADIVADTLFLFVQPLAALDEQAQRSEESRVGNGCVSTCRSRWWPYHLNRITHITESTT